MWANSYHHDGKNWANTGPLLVVVQVHSISLHNTQHSIGYLEIIKSPPRRSGVGKQTSGVARGTKAKGLDIVLADQYGNRYDKIVCSQRIQGPEGNTSM